MVLARFATLILVVLAVSALFLPSCGNGGGVGGGGVGIGGPCGDAGDTGDDDGDGVENQLDLCCDTPPGAVVDADGCTVNCPDGDDDEDGVCNGVDACPATPTKETLPVDEVGCGIFDDCCPCDAEWVSKAAYLTCIANVGDNVVCQEKHVCLLAPEEFDQRCDEAERRRLGKIMRFASEATCAS